ncbi:uncharacterized protein HMPREF1541_10251 [Cyphellophora europaea CBS 101466]|uniref:Carboxylic ester hydrolase n=1 Tax=Cyphellophora europaea (strain CBS 101466) TaxID=1220924 RepID=W2S794_CYPE1|nr:uncharacterized protein HMPREF1541_10251 [Cyphellophora europaea CBS 101466]ETN44581.1 hypothetical protein HMPREF1541_10251 [Cyphellophora europaea CBS 101466]
MSTVKALIAASVTLAIPLAAAQEPSSTSGYPSASIDSGPVIGTQTIVAGSDITVNQYLGIPFAQPPIGELRFSPAQQVESWTDPYEATQQPPACMQVHGRDESNTTELAHLLFNNPPPPSESEDCLYLSVYAPADAEGLPVLFWIYGGSSLSGAVSMPLYDGTYLAANQDIIVVAANYRVNVFGQPTSPALSVEESNPGQLDQHLALSWVQRNIEAFGGDPAKVTIVGESAGALSVSNLMLAFGDEPPFRAAIQMSRGADLPLLLNTGVDSWAALVGLLGCNATSEADELACMREVDAETTRDTVIDSGLSFSALPPDNVTVFDNPAAQFLSGNFSKIPLMTGYTADDGSYFALIANTTIDALASSTFPELAALYGEGGPAVQDTSNDFERVSALLTDLAFKCVAGFHSNWTTLFQDAPVWEYEFNGTVPTNSFTQWPQLGAWHAGEIQYVFGTYDRGNATEIDVALSEMMQKQFADFVKDPERGPGWAPWPAIAVLNAETVDSEAETTVVDDVNELNPQCVLFNDYFYLPQLLEQVGEEQVAGVTELLSGNSSSPGGAAEEAVDTSAARRLQDSTVRLTVVVAMLLGLAVVG